MPQCFVVGCPNASKRRGLFSSYHMIPKARKAEWLKLIGRDPNTFVIYQLVCSEHFEEGSIIKVGSKRVLKKDILPSLNLPQTLPVQKDLSFNVIDHFQYSKAIESTSKNEQFLSLIKVTSQSTNANPEVAEKKKSVIKLALTKSTTGKGMFQEDNHVIPNIFSTLESSTLKKKTLPKSFYNYSLCPKHYKWQISVYHQKHNKQKLKRACSQPQKEEELQIYDEL